MAVIMVRIKDLKIKNLLVWSSCAFIFSCQPQKPLAESQGDLKVLIPLNQVEINQNKTLLSTVTLKSINTLDHVEGSYVHFYYAPGSQSGALAGAAPEAQYIRDKDGTFVAKNYLTQQMFTLYYHVQALTDFTAKVSDNLKSNSAFLIGLNTRLSSNSMGSKNNAFFDGEAQALLFVPYNLKNMPIAINSGIIAHEYFHSLFYKTILKNFNTVQKAAFDGLTQLSDEEEQAKVKKTLYYNQTYIRGVNEGLADFWGWIYTNNPDYISLSLPDFGESRKMVLTDNLVGKYIEQIDIENKVGQASQLSSDPTEFLSGFIYYVGTPHARFLKELTLKISDQNKISVTEAQLLLAQKVYGLMVYLDKLSADQKNKIAADAVFNYFVQPEISGLALKPEACDFVQTYMHNKKLKSDLWCKGKND